LLPRHVSRAHVSRGTPLEILPNRKKMLLGYILEDWNLLALILAGVIKSHNFLERPEMCLECHFAYGSRLF
jgi:hypothetical protein